jgi:anti-sigma factor RsiW
MTSCDKYQARIVALLDNEAGDEDLQSAAGHLRDCAECRAFCRELIGIRRALVSASLPSLSLATRQALLAEVRDDPSGHGESRANEGARFLQAGTLMRWAAVLVIGLLSIACFALGRTAKDLRARLGAAEQQVVAIHEQAKLAESEERQQKAISALYFRMAELEERVSRPSRPEKASLPARVHDRHEGQNDL